MSSARIDKLKSLLARVEQRRAQPRLRAVPSPLAAALAAPAPAASEDFDDDDFAKTEPPPALLLTEKKPTKPPASPLEDAMALLDQSGPLDVQALAEPIAMKPAADARPPEWPRAPEPLARSHPLEPEPLAPVAQRPESKPSLPSAPVELRPVSARPTGSVREPTLRFDTGVEAAPHAQVEIGGLPPGAPPAVAPVAPLAAAPVEPSPLTAPTQSIEPSPLSAAVAPARTVSTVRVEAPRSFGELLELSLALRPR